MDSLSGVNVQEKKMLDRAAQKGVPLNGSIELLPLCNMNCDMCYVRLSPEAMRAKGRMRTGAEWLALGEALANAGTLFLLLTGGEPLLHPDFKAIYLGLKRLGMILTINTNGTLIDESWADFFAENPPRRINITLYGADEAAYESLCHYPGGYEKTVRAVRLLRERGVDVRVNISVARNNYADMDALIGKRFELDVPVVIDTYMMPGVREREKPFDEQSRLTPEDAAMANWRALHVEMGDHLDEHVQRTLSFIEQLPELAEYPLPVGCQAGRCGYTINWQGELHPCVMLNTPTASVFDVGFQAAWAHVRGEVAKIRLNAGCGACRHRVLCRLCAACALSETGHFDGRPEYMCRYTNETVRLFREHAASIAQKD